MNRIVLDLQYFAEEGAAAAGAPAGAEGLGIGNAAENSAPAPVRMGDTLADGTKVPSARVAAALEQQMRRHPELRNVYGQGGTQQQAQEAPQPEQAEQPQTDTIQARWEQAKKGEFKELYGQDVQRAVQERFKNQADAQQQLDALQPMLQVLMKRADTKDLDELKRLIVEDDSNYEEEAEARGMTVEGYKDFLAMQEENRRLKQEEEQNNLKGHIAGLMQQGEELKKIFPDFDFLTEMQNEQFRNATSPEGGMTVKQAYYAIHGDELMPQMLGYGMKRAQEQMGQTIQAQRQRPAEGAMRGQAQQAASLKINPANLTRKERDRIRNLIHGGANVSFD